MSRKIVYQTLEFNNPKRIPKEIWTLPWAKINHPEYLEKIMNDFDFDIISAGRFTKASKMRHGVEYVKGKYVDDWGCEFLNLHEGVIGEVKEPIISDDEWEDLSKVHFPIEWLDFDIDEVNDFCKNNDSFILAGCVPRPFEQMQFLRGTVELYMDLITKPEGMMRFIKKMHSFYLELLEKWAQTDVDALFIMDDWGSQKNLLISPDLWVEIYKPMYKDYCDIAKKYNKKMFMHSDGHILSIYPHLIEIGVDALNSQVFCMGIDELEKYKGQITFWGEIDRQHILSDGSLEDVRDAVKEVYSKLSYNGGGVIAQCEFSAGSKPENVYEVFKTWNKIK